MVNGYNTRPATRCETSQDIRLSEELCPVCRSPDYHFPERNLREILLKAEQLAHHVKVIIAGKRISPDSKFQTRAPHQAHIRQSIMNEYIGARTERHKWMLHHSLHGLDALLIHTYLVHEQNMLRERSPASSLEPVNEIEQ